MNIGNKNAYESGKQKIIPAVLLYAFFKDQVLMIHRNQKENDFHEGKWNGLGGKLILVKPQLNAPLENLKRNPAQKPSLHNGSGQDTLPSLTSNHKNEDWSVTVFRTEPNQEQVNQSDGKTKREPFHLDSLSGCHLPQPLEVRPNFHSLFEKSFRRNIFLCGWKIRSLLLQSDTRLTLSKRCDDV